MSRPTRIIKLKPKKSDKQIEQEARKLLQTGIDTGDDDVLDVAIYQAVMNKFNVAFELNNGKQITPDMAYRLRYERGICLRLVPHQEKEMSNVE